MNPETKKIKIKVLTRIIQQIIEDVYTCTHNKYPHTEREVYRIKAGGKNIVVQSDSHYGCGSVYKVNIETGNVLYHNSTNYIIGNLLDPELYKKMQFMGYIYKGQTKELMCDMLVGSPSNPIQAMSNYHDKVQLLQDVSEVFTDYYLIIKRTLGEVVPEKIDYNKFV